MTDDVKKVLAEATPRPWRPAECDPLEIVSESRIMVASIIRMEGQTWGNGQREANAALILLAVNSYEADQERIRVLTEVVELSDLTLREYQDDPVLLGMRLRNRTALSQAKAVQP